MSETDTEIERDDVDRRIEEAMARKRGAPIWLIGATFLVGFICVIGSLLTVMLEAKRTVEGVSDGFDEVARTTQILQMMRQLDANQRWFQSSDPEGDGQDWAKSISELIRWGMSPPGLGGTRTYAGHYVELRPKPDDAGYELTVEPMSWGRDGNLSFYMDETGVIRSNPGDVAGPDDPPFPGQPAAGSAWAAGRGWAAPMGGS